ncbi:esterase-like activity of phytase family protein [Oscillatoria sp. CS-180]|uniref:esterase-like activity of phytase family protein n=1 Tax=Oscillatoria sp. CS-180 TaxID=3021720 RepID=UPI0023304EA2|nr:esterase-like activity of phytase family protein [Oscillatoria sp. CS-180]MDB9526457.1 esterase-like activity of phytase family protein [Oscillatoria sp. CS-180]
MKNAAQVSIKHFVRYGSRAIAVWPHFIKRKVLLAVLSVLWLVGCSLPQVSAESRLFLPLEVELVDVVTLPKQSFEGTPVGGLSAIAYDSNRNVFYAVSDDKGQLSPPRFYTLDIQTDLKNSEAPKILSVEVQAVTTLKDSTGTEYPINRLDSEGIVLSPRQSVFISSEGLAEAQSPPALNEYDLDTGVLRTEFRLPDRLIPETDEDGVEIVKGVRSNQGLEALTLGLFSSAGAFEPFRLFVATESALAQDFDPNPENPLTNRFLHYLIGPDQSTFIAEHAYPLSLEPMGAVSSGLTELVAVDQGGHFLALERVYGIRGFEIKLFQLATGGATDISNRVALPSLAGINPIRKQLMLDFNTLDSPVEAIDNLEGMTLGPPFSDGTRSLWLISDDNFSDEQTTQIWLFRLKNL